MIKRMFSALVIVTMLASCASKEQKKETHKDKTNKLTVEQVMSDIKNYVDKDVVVMGTVGHVCSHGGKRMFIMGNDHDVTIKVTPSKELGVFEKELEGSHVLITGKVKELKIDQDYVSNLEKELSEGTDNEAVHDHSDGKHENEDEHAEAIKHIEAMKAKIAKSENGYFSQYWIEAMKFEVKECDHDHDHDHDHSHDHGEEHSH